MKPEIKTLWVDALRGGQFIQGRNALRQPDNTYCCLGVLCELAVRAGQIPEPELVGERKNEYFYGQPGDINRVFLPECVQEWAGLEEGTPTVMTQYRAKHTLTALNDGGFTFREIADLIERQL